ncbi:MAG: hypothetical protein GX215_06200 [Clostridiales Family XIII bacterium]|nr:hypothetical protein [Clostridiales Family XIII bacterium]
MIRIYDSENTLLYTIRKVLNANFRETIDGEMLLSFSTTMSSSILIQAGRLAEYSGQYFSIAQVSKSMQNGIAVCNVSCEHISYILNDSAYDITEFYFTGTPAAGLAKILEGTPFSAGVVEMSDVCTMKINQSVSRRAALMQFVAIVNGEIEYSGYSINIRAHRGSAEYKMVMDGKNVTDVSVSYDYRENTASYTLSFFKLLDISVGDNIQIIFHPLNINVRTRIIAVEYNPFYRYNIKVEVGQYKPSVSNTFYIIEKTMSDLEDTVAEISEIGTRYTIEFGKIIGNGTFYFSKAYTDEPYYMVEADDGSAVAVTLLKNGDTYIGGTISGAQTATKTLVVFYCTLPVE